MTLISRPHRATLSFGLCWRLKLIHTTFTLYDITDTRRKHTTATHRNRQWQDLSRSSDEACVAQLLTTFLESTHAPLSIKRFVDK